MENCVFCKIVKGEIPSAAVFEDDSVVAFLDINPVGHGHCLVIPKQHFENVFDIEEVVLENISRVARGLAIKLKDAVAADGVNLVNSSGAEAGQEVMHFHMHVVPRFVDDGLKIFGTRPDAPKPTFEELKKLAENLV